MAPVHLVVGDDELLLRREVEHVLEALRAEDPDLQVEVHEAAQTEHLPELRTASLFGGRTCMVLRGVEALTEPLKGELESYLQAPAEEAVVVLAARGVGRVQKVAKLAKEHGERSDVTTPPDWDDRGWDRLVGEELRRAGRSADAAAVGAIRAHAGTDPATIASKVAQVCEATPREATITAEHVEAVVEGHGRQSGFAVADEVADRDPAAALVALRGALESGQAPLAILGAVVFRFRQLLRVRAGAAPKEAGVSPGRHRHLQEVAGRFGPGELAWCHDRLAQLDVDLKGGELPPELVLELGVIEVATARDVGSPFNPLAGR